MLLRALLFVALGIALTLWVQKGFQAWQELVIGTVAILVIFLTRIMALFKKWTSKWKV